MLVAYTLVLSILTHQDPKPRIVDEKGREEVSRFFQQLPLHEFYDEVTATVEDLTFIDESADVPAWYTTHRLYGLYYLPDEQSVFGVTFRWPEKPFSTAEVSVADALQTARECSVAILPHFGAWDVKLQVATESEYHILATPMIGDIFTKEYINLRIRRSDGLPVSIGRNSPMLDYTVFGGKEYITKERAVQVGLDAYSRFHPYEAGVVDRIRLMMGPPSWNPDIPHEVRQEDIDYMNRKVALPLYWITVADRHRSGRVQHIYVHAIEGRTLSIWANSGFSAGSAIESSLGDGAVRAKFGNGKESVTLKPTTERQEKLDDGLPVVSLAIGDAVYAARVDEEHERLWLWTDRRWAAYTVDAGAFKVLVGSTVKPGTFGKKTDKNQAE